MSKKYFAFKLEAQGRLRELKTKVEIGAPSLIDSRPYNEKDFLEIQAVWDTGATATVIAEDIPKPMIRKKEINFLYCLFDKLLNFFRVLKKTPPFRNHTVLKTDSFKFKSN